MSMLVIMLIGGVALWNLQLDMLPAINPPVLAIITELPGASAQEVLTLVTEPVEAVAATTAGIKELRSITREGISFVILQFNWDTKMSEARTELVEKLDLLPLSDDAGKPRIIKFDPSLLPLMQVFVAAGEDMELDSLTSVVEKRIKPRLEAVPGVASVGINGGVAREIRVELERDNLYSHGVGLGRVAGIIAQSASNLPAGSVSHDEREINVRLVSSPQNSDDIAALVVAFAGPLQVRVNDLGRVMEAVVATDSITRLNTCAAVGLHIQKEGSSNTVSVAGNARKALAQAAADLPDLQIEVMLDQGRFIEYSLRSTAVSLLIGGFFALLVLMAFLGSIISTAIVAVAVPFSILATFALMYLSGMTLNIMTLGGLALGVGMLVDNSIVVIENIYRHLQLGKKREEAAAVGCSEVAGAISAATLTTLVVFLPVVFVGGLTGTLFRELAVTVTYALLASLLISLTVIPLLASRWLKEGSVVRRRKSMGVIFSYGRRLLLWGLAHRALVLATALLLFGLSIAAVPRIGTEFLPAVDEGIFTVDLRLPAGTRLLETSKRAERIENELRSVPEVERVTAQVGTGGTFSGVRTALSGGASNSAQLIVTLRPGERSTLDVMGRTRELLLGSKEDDEEIVLNLYSSLFFAPGNSANLLQLTVNGPDFARLKQLANDIVKVASDIPGLTNVQTNLDVTLPEFHVRVKGDDALRYGLTPFGVGQEVSRALRGQVVGRLRGQKEALNIRVILQEDDRQTIDDLEKIPLETAAPGLLVSLGSVAEVSEGSGPATITREEQRESIEINGQIEGRDIGTLLTELQQRVDEMGLPEGYEVRSAGAALLMEQGFASLRQAFLLSLVLIYMVLAAQFESLRTPFVIIFTAPLAVIGVVGALLLTRTPLGITAYIGIIILGGVVVNNGIVLVDLMEKLYAAGSDAKEAAVDAVRLRLRPVLMTALTTILGLLPLAAKLGEGSELQAPLATVVIGGLLSATLLTLLVIPVLYTMIRHRRTA
jgi:HAE1 family hydrophobic/amphiphilic exporter-1